MSRYLKLITLIAVALILFTGCNLNKKIGDKIGEKVTEDILENAAGEDVDVNVDGDDVTFKTKDGEVSVKDDEVTVDGDDGKVKAGGDYEWPKGDAADKLPEFKEGKITYILNSDTNCMLMIEEVKSEDYESYVKAVQNKGYTNDTVESTSEEASVYSAASEDGVTVTVVYYNEDKSLQITAEITE